MLIPMHLATALAYSPLINVTAGIQLTDAGPSPVCLGSDPDFLARERIGPQLQLDRLGLLLLAALEVEVRART